MLEKLVVGRYLDFDVPPDESILDGPPDHGFQRVRRTVLHIAESKSSAAPVGELPSFPGASVKVKAALGLQHAGAHLQSQFQRQRVSALGAGEAAGGEAKAHRNFVWLPWLKGLVSEASPEGFDLFTGPMSGCWITTYRRGGADCVGHVGTYLTRDSDESVAALGAWHNFVAGPPAADVVGFLPRWAGPIPPPLPGEGSRQTYALLTGGGLFYTVVLYGSMAKLSRKRIAGVQQTLPSLPANGQIPPPEPA